MTARTSSSESTPPPHDLQAEGAVLSAILIRGREALEDIDGVLDDPRDCYAEAHMRILEAARAVREDGLEPDIVTVGSRLRDTNRIASVGGLGYLTEVLNAAPAVSSDRLRGYAQRVRELAALRRLIATCDQTSATARVGVTDIPALFERHARTVSTLSALGREQPYRRLSEVVHGVYATLLERAKTGAKVLGAPTGLSAVDAKLRGYQAGKLYIVAARPGMGKSAFIMQGALAAARWGGGVMVFEIEMPDEEIGERSVCSTAEVSLSTAQTGGFTPHAWTKVADACTQLSTLPLFIDTTSGITTDEMRRKLRRVQIDLAKENRDLRLVVIDYLQLMRGRPGAQSRDEAISEITRELKAIAKDFNVPVVALSQLNRKVEERSDKRPLLSDLRECVVGDTSVVMAGGRRVAIRDLVGTRPRVLSFSKQGTLVEAESSLVWSVGLREVVTVRLGSGRTLRATPDHRVCGEFGWMRIRDCMVGDRLAVWPDGSEHVCLGRIQSIKPSGVDEVFDMTVPGPESWLADGIVSHNSGAIEQDADVVCFLYRESYYNRQSVRPEVAEVIIAKHRGGELGDVAVGWHGWRTSFYDLPDSEMPE